MKHILRHAARIILSEAHEIRGCFAPPDGVRKNDYEESLTDEARNSMESAKRDFAERFTVGCDLLRLSRKL